MLLMPLSTGRRCLLCLGEDGRLIDVTHVPCWKRGRKILLGRDPWDHCMAFSVENWSHEPAC